jgi:hypothetical protein
MAPGNGCGGGRPCIYVNKGTWIPYEEVGQFSPPPTKTESWKDPKATLFVMIASFRDKLCPKTLFNLYTKAKYPSRIFVGVVEQNFPDDIDCMKEYCRLMAEHDPKHASICPFQENIRVEKKDASSAKVLNSHKCSHHIIRFFR